jgi:dipeptidyl aminopeptidase/acylaminoacyl peptidase
MNFRRLVVLLFGLGLALGAGFWYWRAAPTLLEVFPVSESRDVPASLPLRLVFSRPMQTATVETRLSFQPARRGTFSWEGNTLVFFPDQPWPAGETVNVRLAAGAQSADLIPLSLRDEHNWSFTVGRPLLAYLWPSGGLADLYALDPASGEITRLTNSSFGALDFNVSDDGSNIYISMRNAAGGSDFYRLERSPESTTQWSSVLVLACPQAYCRSPRLSPDGQALAFERAPLPGSGDSLHSQVWLLDLEGGSTGGAGPQAEELASDPNHPAHSPAWSSQGQLAYYDVIEKAYLVLDRDRGTAAVFPNETGEPASWSPLGDHFVAPEILSLAATQGSQVAGDTISASHLIRFDPESAASRDLSRGPFVEDTSPSFSPDGSYLAFARRYLDASRWTPGRQAWVMRSDGSEAIALTNAASYSHSGFAWSPDGRQIAYLRFNQETLTDPLELWMVAIDGNNPIQLVIGGFAPQWIP